MHQSLNVLLTGVYVALPGDWCVDANNTADPSVVCSTQQPVCDAGYSGKCIALPEASMQAIPAADGPSKAVEGPVQPVKDPSHHGTAAVSLNCCQLAHCACAGSPPSYPYLLRHMQDLID
jgi:hypothetical protein